MKNPFDTLKQEAPQVAEAFNNLISAISNTGGLDAKTRQLVFVGIKAAQGDTAAAVAHTPMAKKEGATREEIRDTILMTLTVSGIQGITHCLIPVLDAYDRAGLQP
ncbi:carboxymuconolactone decarboxylase family protein [Ruminiclostridium hungatei]|uniref:Carboxymuconolactone decarboxylase family protein n=1 Tax=Ruminiclostridium hungatei TaxID=48256 RepID=A0A1V4SJU2_RUMHU|nr:carboxymuconolactone decarboxylase family protein [Ruminiclostridium hungatei]OPX44084.1 carboxymuconolactone decarboxylase family protein [Ruminiclostridium hungatei]